MKIIFSRKGFDSGYGGKPSAFVSGETMVSFPIPEKPDKHEREVDPSLVGYDGLRVERRSSCERERMSLCERMGMLYGGEIASRWKHCHNDPDLRNGRGVFGQSGTPQKILDKGQVDAGDLFLFFGWFREAHWFGDALRFRSPQRNVHALFGFLRVKEVLLAHEAAEKYRCFRDHPHLTAFRLEADKHPKARKPNKVYIAAKCLDIPGMGNCPGFGVLQHAPKLVLTAKKENADKYEPRSFWQIPKFFDGAFRTNNIRRIKDGKRKGLCSTKGQWQECVADADSESQQKRIQEWALERIRIGMRID